MDRTYAGIGSRRTPQDVCQIMVALGHKLAKGGWILRSGGADGADVAFERGADLVQGQKEIILPWLGFNGNRGNLVIGERESDQWAYETAQENFPWFSQQKVNVRKLLARNMMQVLGIRGDEPCAAVICWTDVAKGGTNYAMTLAEKNGIPVWNLHDEVVMGKAHLFLSDSLEGDPWPEQFVQTSQVRKTVSVAVRVVGFGGKDHLMSQRIAGPHSGLWQFPGGHVEPEETLEEAGIREVREEAGIVVEIDRLLVTYIDYEGDFVCSILQSKPYLGLVPQNPEEKKHTRWVWKDYVPEPRFDGLQLLVERGILRGES